jgi:hypothetical protein
MDLQTALTGLYENAGLTSRLEDEPADRLLAWGAGLIRGIYLAAENGGEVPGREELRAVRRLLRAVNRWAPSANTHRPTTNLKKLQKIRSRAQFISPMGSLPDDQDFLALLSGQEERAQLDWIEGLIALFQ